MLHARLVLAVSAALLLTAPIAGAGRRPIDDGPGLAIPGTATQSFFMNAVVRAQPASSECENNPGPYIRLDGTITLGGLDARLRFSNNRRGTHVHEEDVTTTVELVSDAPIAFAKQPSRGGVGGNPWIWLQLESCATGEALSEPVLLGRCVQGLSIVELDALVGALASVAVTTGGCSNSPGPTISLLGQLALGGICANLIFTNNEAFTHVHEEDVSVQVELIPEGQSITFAKQPPLGGAGGNPHIFLQFLRGDGTPIGGEIYLGRCNQLGR